MELRKLHGEALGYDWMSKLSERGKRAYARGRLVARSGESLWVQCVEDGFARAVNYTSSGRRQITRLFLRGDFIGLSYAPSDIEAASTLVVQRSRRGHPMQCKDGPARLAHLRDKFMKLEASLLLQQLTVVTLGTAETRLAWLLLRCMRHAGARDGEFFPLPLARADIADHLALNTETVCRTVSAMRRLRLLEEHGRRNSMAIHDVAALRRLVEAL